jgi:uncharacterized membrane protein YphA (DoxX/SURF4 family)
MLNPFPVQFLALFAYFILRLFVGGVLLYLGIRHLKYKVELRDIFRFSWFPFGTFSVVTFAVGELVLAVLILVGAYTQIAALLVGAMSLKMVFLRNYFHHHTIPPKIFYVLLLGVAVTLFITGAGVLAFDLPI